MTSPSATLRLCACLIFAGPPAAAYAQAVPDTARIGSLAGVIVDSLDNGMADVEVTLVRTSFSGVTNAEGAFFIPAIPAVRYLATLTVTKGDRRGLYPEVFPVEVVPGQPSGVVFRVSRALLEDSLVFAEPDDEGVAGALADIGIQMDAQLRSVVRKGRAATDPVRITGVVRDAQTGKGIANVAVAIEGTELNRLSDERGRFTFEKVQPGSYALSSTTLGYAARREELIVTGGPDLDVQISLSQEAIELEPILVEARSAWLARTGFYERRDDPGNFGKIITRKDIEGRAYSSVVDLFHGIPGARVDYAGLGQRVIKFRRVVGMRGGDGCTPSLYLDGMRMSNDWEFISPDWIEAVEVYVGATRAPLQYANNPCGAVLIWTRRG